MKKLFLCLIIFVCLYGCKDKKYTEAELRVEIQKVIDSYEKSIIPQKQQQAKDDGYNLGKDTGQWEEKMKLLQELELQLPKNIVETLDKYRREKWI